MDEVITWVISVTGYSHTRAEGVIQLFNNTRVIRNLQAEGKDIYEISVVTSKMS